MGLKIDDRKVEAVKQMQAPKDKKGLQSFQGMVNYLKRYSAQLTRLFQPLKPLLLEDIEWSWDSSHKEAFDGIKEELTRTPVLAFFNPKAEHVIQTDASLKGLGAVCSKKEDQWSMFPGLSLQLRNAIPILKDSY